MTVTPLSVRSLDPNLSPFLLEGAESARFVALSANGLTARLIQNFQQPISAAARIVLLGPARAYAAKS